MIKQLLTLIVLVYGQHGIAQNWTNTNEIWQDDKIVLSEKNKKVNSIIGQVNVVQLNIVELKNVLVNSPERNLGDEFTENIKSNYTVLQMPMPDGGFHAFKVAQAPVMHPHLANKFPKLKAYIGKGIDDPTAILRFDVTPNGFHGMILSGNDNDIFIDPIISDKNDQYKVYYKKDIDKSHEWSCNTEYDIEEWNKTKNKFFTKSIDCQLRTYRFALACTGEYAQYHGGTTELVLSAMHNSITRLNGILERDLSVHLELVVQNDLLVFPNQFIDPYTNNDAAAMLDENQITCDEIIGEENYDIGHVFSTKAGGAAQLKSVCQNGLKAQGVTGSATPGGDQFDVDYVAHEIGHQLGARHTHNNDCNRNEPTAVEPGSGSSIMGYAGICIPNIQNYSDAYFHTISISEINDFLSADGDLCTTVYNINNGPSADTGPDYYIPRSTPFKLTGVGNDDSSMADLTYNWEQIDNQVSVMPPVAVNKIGPLFRSVNPSSSPSRIFPNISSIIENEPVMWEVIPNCEREINFRFTVRDNHQYAGCVATDDMTLHVVGNAGPFIVENPIGIWIGGSEKMVSWDVAGTNEMPVNSQFVDILLSMNGGNSFPNILASNVPNNGHVNISVPNINSGRARLMVRSSNNVFFDISDQDFRVIPADDFWVELQIEDLKCNNDNTGRITALVHGEKKPSYLWSNGSTDDYIDHLSNGNYSVTVTAGIKTATSFGVVNNALPLELDLEIENQGNSGEIILNANSKGGTGKYNYTWGSGAFQPFIKINLPGDYSVTVVDENDCQISNNKRVFQSDISNYKQINQDLLNDAILENFIQIFPNPSSGIANIEFVQVFDGGPQILLFDVMGQELKNERILYQKKGMRNISIDISVFKNGIYFLQIVEGHIKKTVKIVKM